MKKPDLEQLRERLAEAIEAAGKQNVVLLGIGNMLRGDDGFGMLVASRLLSEMPGRVFAAETTPENFLGPICQRSPRLVIIIDAVNFDGTPGELRLVGVHQLRGNSLGTHAPSLSLIQGFLAAECGAQTLVLAAQPKEVGTGLKPSAQVSLAVETAARILKEALE